MSHQTSVLLFLLPKYSGLRLSAFEFQFKRLSGRCPKLKSNPTLFSREPLVRSKRPEADSICFGG